MQGALTVEENLEEFILPVVDRTKVIFIFQPGVALPAPIPGEAGPEGYVLVKPVLTANSSRPSSQ